MQTTALIIFIITYVGIIFTRLPKVNIDRPSAAFFGAVAMVVFGVLDFDEAIRAIDFDTIALLLGKIKPSDVIAKVDWVLLLFFASLFIVVEGIEQAGLLSRYIDGNLLKENVAGLGMIHGVSLIMTQIVSNVPFTIVMLPFMKVADSELLWLCLASASTLAGNATIIGAIANLIFIESADRLGVKIGFFEFLKPGLITTLLSFVISFGVLYLYLIVG